MASSSGEMNAATETLKCDGPFEVLRLRPGVYQPLDIKRQYRRLALVLHPDKNRHPDAEPAFKKLTAAFENLHDPSKQALSRAEAFGRQHKNRAREDCSGSSSSRGSPDSSNHTPGYGESGGRSRCYRAGDAPRWCREGEHVPEAEQEKEAKPDAGERKSRSIDEFMEDFEQQEKTFREEVAKAKERSAEKKRAKAEARSAADQERVNRLRDEVLGGGEDGASGAMEAKTANWQKFTSRKTPKRGPAGGAWRRQKSTRVSSGEVGTGRSQGESPEMGRGLSAGGGGDSCPREGNTKGTPSDGRDLPNVVRETVTAGPGFVCLVCRRGFKSAKGLANHEANSELHEINVQLREFMSFQST